MSVALFSLGFMFYFDSLGISALFSMLLYIAGFAVKWEPVTWVLLSENFPNKIRSKGMAIAVAQWIANYLVSWTFPMMNKSSFLTDTFNHGFAYWIYGIMGFIAALLVWNLVTDTKEKSLEEL